VAQDLEKRGPIVNPSTIAMEQPLIATLPAVGIAFRWAAKDDRGVHVSSLIDVLQEQIIMRG
jgi:hypothetical protein